MRYSKLDRLILGGFLYPLLRIYAPLLLPLLSSILLIQLISASHASAWDYPFNNAANWGGTGLMEIPNARVLEDGVIRFGAAQALPYRWYTGGMGILPRLEVSLRLTEISNIPSGLGPGYGSNKDKALDLKYQILPESKRLPAIAIGMHDFHGTRIFPSEYLVISRQYYPLDFTLGIGSKRLKGPIDMPYLDKYGLFGGVEIELNDRFHFIAEYNPIEYEKDIRSARGVPEGAKYPVNVGLRARLLGSINLGLSYQRGNTLGIMLHVQAELGEPVLPYRPDPAPLLPIDRRPFNERDQKEMIEKIYEAIRDAGFSDVVVYTDGADLIASFANTKYFSDQKAVGRVLRILLFHSPNDTELLTAVVKRYNMPILKISVKPEHMEKYLLGEISDDIFFEKLMKIQVTRQSVEPQDRGYIQTKKDAKLTYSLGIKPDFDYYWNDPSRFFMYTVAVQPYFAMNLWKGAQVYFRYDFPLYSTIHGTTGSFLPSYVIRSDVSKYLGDSHAFDRLLINQAFRISEKSFGRVSLGYLETMYAGISGEALFFPGEGKIALGIQGDWVRKRVPEKEFDLFDFNRYSVLGKVYYYYQKLDLTFITYYGRFLAGDVGWMFDINRQYSTGVTVGVYLGFTDTDDIKPEFNKGYHNKGVYLSIPLRMLLTRDSVQSLDWTISPWTRDVGEMVYHYHTLFGLAKDLMPAIFKVDLNEIRE